MISGGRFCGEDNAWTGFTTMQRADETLPVPPDVRFDNHEGGNRHATYLWFDRCVRDFNGQVVLTCEQVGVGLSTGHFPAFSHSRIFSEPRPQSTGLDPVRRRRSRLSASSQPATHFIGQSPPPLSVAARQLPRRPSGCCPKSSPCGRHQLRESRRSFPNPADSVLARLHNLHRPTGVVVLVSFPRIASNIGIGIERPTIV